jgi:hypothetical protein
VQLVFDEQLGAGLPVGVQSRVVGFDVAQARRTRHVLRHQRVQPLGGITLVPPGDAGRERYEDDYRLRQRPVNLRHERLEIRKDLLRRLAVVEVVPARAQEDRAWPIRQDDPIGEMRGIRNLVSAEAAVDDRRVRKVLR